MSRNKAKNPLRSRLDDIVKAAQSAAKGKGWHSSVKSLDTSGWRYATLSVARGDAVHPVEGLLELSIEDSAIKCQALKTSFYGTGLDGLSEAAMSEIRRLPWVAAAVAKPTPTRTSGAESERRSDIVRALRRFDRFVRQLGRRHDSREPIAIRDEYDAQDLIHALLRCLSDDVRPEEVAPTHAGASSRMDFLLKAERTVVEVKVASEKLRDKQIGDQLIIDIQRYQAHPDCKSLVCVVYDAGSHIRNPVGLETDLSGRQGDLDVRVIVTPQ